MSRIHRTARALRFSVVTLVAVLALPLAGAEAPALAVPSATQEELRPCEALSSRPAQGQALLAGLSDLQPIFTPAPSSAGNVHRAYFAGTTAWGTRSVVGVTCSANCNGHNWVRGCRPYIFQGQGGCTPIECVDFNGIPRKGSCLVAITPDEGEGEP